MRANLEDTMGTDAKVTDRQMSDLFHVHRHHAAGVHLRSAESLHKKGLVTLNVRGPMRGMWGARITEAGLAVLRSLPASDYRRPSDSVDDGEQ
jgi:hypothetical protein